VHVGVLEEEPGLDLLEHLLLLREVVGHAVHFALARAARRVAHGEAEGLRELFQQQVDERALAHTRRAGDHDGLQLSVRRLEGREVLGREGHHVLRLLQQQRRHEAAQQRLDLRVLLHVGRVVLLERLLALVQQRQLLEGERLQRLGGLLAHGLSGTKSQMIHLRRRNDMKWS